MAEYARIVFNRIPEVQLELEARVQELADHAAEITAEEARARAPVLTGRLRDSIGAEGGRVTVGAPYAAFVEYGTAHNAAEPFLTPAVSGAVPRIEEEAAAIGRSL